MGRPIKAERVERIRQFMKRNTDPQRRRQPIYGIFSRLAACRNKPESHRTMLEQLRMFEDQSRVVRGFNAIAEREGRTDRLYDMVPSQMGHNGGPRIVN